MRLNTAKRALAALSAAVLAALGALVLVPASAHAAVDTCRWTGGVSADWSDSGNWIGCDNGGVPENGDDLYFPAGSANTAMNNDIPGLVARVLTFDAGAGYSISGSPFTITYSLSATENVVVNAEVTFGTGAADNPRVNASADKSVVFNGAIHLAGASFATGDPAYTGDVVLAGSVDGSPIYVAPQAGSLTVQHATNSYTATIFVYDGAVFECRSLSCFGDAANLVRPSGGSEVRFTQPGASYPNPVSTMGTDHAATLEAEVSTTLTGPITVSVRPLTFAAGPGATLTATGGIDNNEGLNLWAYDTGTVRLDGAISGAGCILATGAPGGKAELRGSNSYAGLTTVASVAELVVAHANALGAAGQGTVVFPGGTLSFDAATPITVAEPLTLGGGGRIMHLGALRNVTSVPFADVALTGDIELTEPTSIYNGSASDLELLGAISGTGPLHLYAGIDGNNDPGIEIGGTAPNTYTGGTYARDGGSISLDKTGSIPGDLTLASTPSLGSPGDYYRIVVYVYADNAIADTGVVTLTNAEDDISFSNAATPEVIGGLVGAVGQISFDSHVTVIVDQSVDSVFGGDFYSDGRVASFVKRGTGRLELTGVDTFQSDEIDYSVEGGSLAVNGDLRTTHGGDVEVRSGATLLGTGKVREVGVRSGGSLAPGNSPGTLNVVGLALDAGGTHIVELASDASYDRVVASGTVTLAGTLDLRPSYTPALGTSFVIVQAGVVNGTYAGLADGAEFTASGQWYRIDYAGNGVTLVAIAEPGTGTTPDPSPGTGADTGTDPLTATGGGDLAPLLRAGAVLALLGAALLGATRLRRAGVRR